MSSQMNEAHGPMNAAHNAKIVEALANPHPEYAAAADKFQRMGLSFSVVWQLVLLVVLHGNDVIQIVTDAWAVTQGGFIDPVALAKLQSDFPNMAALIQQILTLLGLQLKPA